MQEEVYILLLHKQLNGQLDDAESIRLDEWLRESPDNQRFAEEIRQVWAATGSYAPQFSPDLDAAFARVQDKICATGDLRPATKIVPLYRQLLRVAAVLVFALAAVWIFRQFGTATPDTRIELAQNEAPRALDLPDGSRVWLRKGARLEFPKQFTGTERRVQLDGEAYFEVAHDAAHPFRVATSAGELIEVLGTQFGVRVSPNDQEGTAVVVKSGKVRFSPDGRQEGAYLEAGKRGVYDRVAAKIAVFNVYSFNDLAWQTGGLEFVHTPLSHVIEDLENWYGVDIELKNQDLASCPHTAPLTSQPIERVLESLALTYQLQVSNPAPKKYVLAGGSCR